MIGKCSADRAIFQTRGGGPHFASPGPQRPCRSRILSQTMGTRMTVLAVVLLASMVGAASARAGDARSACPSSTTDAFFFPPAMLDSDRGDLDDLRRHWYSKHLRTMGEPSLSCGAVAESETYRFTWLRTFDRPIAVRVSSSESAVHLVAIELSGAGGYDPGGVAKRIERSLSSADWKALVAVLGKIDFWTMPTNPTPFEVGLDGARWILEGRRRTEYHVVDRFSAREGAYRDAGLTFLNLAGLLVSGEKLY